MQYARFIDKHTVQPPDPKEFKGVPNYLMHDSLLRQHNYLPLIGEPEPRLGVTAEPAEYALQGDHIQITAWKWVPIPEPIIPDTSERDNAEKAIVAAIAALAQKYDAIQDIASMEDITIPNLRALAVEKGVPDEEFGALITTLTPYKWQLEAVTGLVWADCWEGLKSRFMQWMQEILGNQ